VRRLPVRVTGLRRLSGLAAAHSPAAHRPNRGRSRWPLPPARPAPTVKWCEATRRRTRVRHRATGPRCRPTTPTATQQPPPPGSTGRHSAASRPIFPHHSRILSTPGRLTLRDQPTNILRPGHRHSVTRSPNPRIVFPEGWNSDVTSPDPALTSRAAPAEECRHISPRGVSALTRPLHQRQPSAG
jgi:hypothetical protein